MVYVMKEIIAAVDFSDVSVPVLETAVKITQALGGQLHLVHVLRRSQPTPPMGSPQMITPPCTKYRLSHHLELK